MGGDDIRVGHRVRGQCLLMTGVVESRKSGSVTIVAWASSHITYKKMTTFSV